jgi:hypothetical protein
MSDIEIGSFFTIDGQPAIHLGEGIYSEFPKIRIYEIVGDSQLPIVTDEIMANVGDGFYSFVFDSISGYDSTKKYRIRMDGGDSVSDQYQVAVINPSDSALNIGDQVWDTIPNNTIPGSAGYMLNAINSSQDGINLSLNDISDLIQLCVKYQTNRTKIDMENKTLSVYDNDCTTILRSFKLLDEHGYPSTDNVVERVPIFATDDKPVC